MSQAKTEHLKIQHFCEEIQTKFAQVLLERETLLIQVMFQKLLFFANSRSVNMLWILSSLLLEWFKKIIPEIQQEDQRNQTDLRERFPLKSRKRQKLHQERVQTGESVRMDQKHGRENRKGKCGHSEDPTANASRFEHSTERENVSQRVTTNRKNYDFLLLTWVSFIFPESLSQNVYSSTLTKF